MQILLVNETISVLVDHIEGFFELLDLRLVEHGEHVGRGPLGTLLGGLSLGAFARHADGWIWACVDFKFVIEWCHSFAIFSRSSMWTRYCAHFSLQC